MANWREGPGILGRLVNPRGEAPLGLVLGAFQVIGGTGRWVLSYSRSHGSRNSLQNAEGGLNNSLHSLTIMAGVFSVVFKGDDVEAEVPKK